MSAAASNEASQQIACECPVTWGPTVLGCGSTAVAVATTASTEDQVLEQAQDAADGGADLVELRLDLYDPEGNAPTYAALAEKVCFQIAPTPVLLTLRSKHEGGQAQVSNETYRDLLLELIDVVASSAALSRPVAVDVELGRECLPQISAVAHAAGLDVVASFHDFYGTPDENELLRLLHQMEDGGANVAKIAVMPHDAVDVTRLLAVTARAREALRIPLAAMSMGGLGAVTRVSGNVFGSCLTFAVVPGEDGSATPSAPGQLPIAQVRQVMGILGR